MNHKDTIIKETLIELIIINMSILEKIEYYNKHEDLEKLLKLLNEVEQL